VTYLINNFYNSVDNADRKVALRHLKAIWINLNPCDPSAVELLLNKKQKTFSLAFPHLYQMITGATQDSVSLEII
jgi:hypothetical protein